MDTHRLAVASLVPLDERAGCGGDQHRLGGEVVELPRGIDTVHRQAARAAHDGALRVFKILVFHFLLPAVLRVHLVERAVLRRNISQREGGSRHGAGQARLLAGGGSLDREAARIQHETADHRRGISGEFALEIVFVHARHTGIGQECIGLFGGLPLSVDLFGGGRFTHALLVIVLVARGYTQHSGSSQHEGASQRESHFHHREAYCLD